MSTIKELRIQAIDNRVARLEKIHGEWMASHGCENPGIMKLINELMDERDEIIHAD